MWDLFGSERVKNAVLGLGLVPTLTLTLTLKQQSVKKKIEPGPDPRFTNTQLLAVLKSNLFRSIDFSTAVATVETGLSLWTCSRKEKREICVFRKKFSLLSALDYG